MTSECPVALASLDDSLEAAYESLRRLELAGSVDEAEITRQLKTAVERARELRSAVSSELPHASWEDRDQLERLIDAIPEKVDERESPKWYFLFARWARGV